MRLLVAAAADLDAKDVAYRTPLHAASDAGDAALVAELLALRASVGEEDADGLTALDVAQLGPTFAALRSAGGRSGRKPTTEVAEAARRNEPLRLAALLEKDFADPNSCDAARRPAALFAAEHGGDVLEAFLVHKPKRPTSIRAFVVHAAHASKAVPGVYFDAGQTRAGTSYCTRVSTDDIRLEPVALG